jgi:hypothetical protein
VVAGGRQEIEDRCARTAHLSSEAQAQRTAWRAVPVPQWALPASGWRPHARSHVGTPAVRAHHHAIRQAQLEAQYGDEGVAVPKPPHWGGFLIRPLAVEFWQGRCARGGGACSRLLMLLLRLLLRLLLLLLLRLPLLHHCVGTLSQLCAPLLRPTNTPPPPHPHTRTHTPHPRPGPAGCTTGCATRAPAWTAASGPWSGCTPEPRAAVAVWWRWWCCCRVLYPPAAASNLCCRGARLAGACWLAHMRACAVAPAAAVVLMPVWHL